MADPLSILVQSLRTLAPKATHPANRMLLYELAAQIEKDREETELLAAQANRYRNPFDPGLDLPPIPATGSGVTEPDSQP